MKTSPAMRAIRLRVERLETRRLLAQWVNVDDPIEVTEVWTDSRQLTQYEFAESSTFRFRDAPRYVLNRERLQEQIDQKGTVILPDPQGHLHRFSIDSSDVMSAELAVKFPMIQAFAGNGIDDPSKTLRLELSSAGLHAQVLSPQGGFLIDPYYHLSDALYAVYRRGDEAIVPDFDLMPPLESVAAAANAAHSNHSADSHAADSFAAESHADDGAAARSGTQLRTYRAAIAATGEYTTFHGGSVALAQTAIVSAINRINGIYEQEFSIRLQLVADNDQIIYTNPNTDPYTNNNLNTILGENQTNVDNVIGSANYDIGHVFVTTGGGLAFLGVVGNSSLKAQGASGLTSPTGDAFFVDIVAHELGHQFDAEHTWSGDSSSCSSASYSAPTAMEPGSGSTIMAYAGICGNDNIQFETDPYFHSISFDQVIHFVDNSIPSIGTRTATSNDVPNVNAGLDYSIPALTPFALTGTASDSNGDDLTYVWEQRDAGPRQDLSAGDTGNNPLFRSVLPSSNPVRTFPQLASLIQNTPPPIGETLPSTTRALNFRFTARDNRPNGGAVNTDDVVINVVNTGSAFTLLGPNGAESFAPVSQQTVTWNVAGTTANGIDTPNVNILLSLDGGFTFPILLAKNVPNDGTHPVVFPDVNTNAARLKVEGAGNVFFDLSDANFSIGTPAGLSCSTFENFDAAAAPALPTGWMTASSGAVPDWVTLGSGSDSAPNHAFVPNVNNTGESSLISPMVTGPERIRFQHFYNSETDFDGGVLELSTDGTNFVDVIDAGGAFTAGGYNATIPFFSNPLAGRQAWSGNSGDYVVSEIALPGSAVGGNVWFRWRFGTDESVADTGWRVDTIELCNPPEPEIDLGDAPDPTYPTLRASDGAEHTIGGTLFLGVAVDHDADGQPNATASGDDNDGTDDESGVTLPATIAAGETVTIPIVASTDYGLLNAWIDYNADGDWDDAAEQVFIDQPLVNGVNNLPLTVPTAVTAGTTYARFRLSTSGNLSPRGPAIDGEVEDYAVALTTASEPTVIATVVNDGNDTRSELTRLTITFDHPVTTPDNAFQVFQRGTNTPVSALNVSSSVNASNHTVVELTFGAPDPLVVARPVGNTLINGDYQLTINAALISRTDGGGTMAADYQFGDNTADEFFRKYGDENGNNVVDLMDFALFRGTFGQSSTDPSYLRGLDSDDDATIGLIDFANFRGGFGS